MLVGDDGYLTQIEACECESMPQQNKTLCRICYASLVFDVLSRR